MITSTQNSKVKEIRDLQAHSKARRAQQAFVVEGVRLCEEALEASWGVRYCLYSPDLTGRGMELVNTLNEKGVEAESAAEHVIKAASETKTPQGIVMVLDAASQPLPSAAEFVLVLDQIGDPGNVGSLLRTAAAAGVQAVLASSGSVDLFSPKVIRSGMGAHFRLPVATLPAEEIIETCQGWDVQLWASVMEQGIPFTQAALGQPAALIVGSEAEGVGEELLQAAKKMHIPMPGGSESLNAAAAGAILIYEAVRQRSQ